MNYYHTPDAISACQSIVFTQTIDLHLFYTCFSSNIRNKVVYQLDGYLYSISTYRVDLVQRRYSQMDGTTQPVNLRSAMQIHPTQRPKITSDWGGPSYSTERWLSFIIG